MGSRIAFPVVTVLLLSLIVACADVGPYSDEGALPTEGGVETVDPISVQLAKLPPDVQQGIADLRKATSPLHNLNNAMAAGFDTDLTGCLDNQGHHYGMLSRIDGAAPVADEPELLVYSPKSNGKLQLGAVEFIIPFDAWTAPEPPELFGQTFHENTGAGLWVLHVWLWNHNPDGLFADGNPTVSCP